MYNQVNRQHKAWCSFRSTTATAGARPTADIQKNQMQWKQCVVNTTVFILSHTTCLQSWCDISSGAGLAWSVLARRVLLQRMTASHHVPGSQVPWGARYSSIAYHDTNLTSTHSSAAAESSPETYPSPNSVCLWM